LKKINDDRIPTSGEHRGIGLHAGQSPRRLEAVKRDIDQVFGLSTVEDLMRCLRNATLAPEARLYSAAKLEVMHNVASKARDATDRHRFG
jgi:hypothetical protein